MNKTISTQNYSPVPIKPTTYIKQEPYVNNTGIWIPCEAYTPEGCAPIYKCLITKELFVEAFNKWLG